MPPRSPPEHRVAQLRVLGFAVDQHPPATPEAVTLVIPISATDGDDPIVDTNSVGRVETVTGWTVAVASPQCGTMLAVQVATIPTDQHPEGRIQTTGVIAVTIPSADEIDPMVPVAVESLRRPRIDPRERPGANHPCLDQTEPCSRRGIRISDSHRVGSAEFDLSIGFSGMTS